MSSKSSEKPNSEKSVESLADLLRDSIRWFKGKKNFKKIDQRSSVSPLRSCQSAPSSSGRTPLRSCQSVPSSSGQTTTSTSSSSSGSVSGRNVATPVTKQADKAGKSASGSSSMSCESSKSAEARSGADKQKRSVKPRHKRSDSAGSVQRSMSVGSASSEPVKIPPMGNVCRPGYAQRILQRETTYLREQSEKGMASENPEVAKNAGNEYYKRGNFLKALRLYDRARSLSPANAVIRSNRAAALMGLGQLAEAFWECGEAIKLDPGYATAYCRLSSVLLRLGAIEDAKKQLSNEAAKPSRGELEKLEKVEMHISKCSEARKRGNHLVALRESDAAISAGADSCPQLFACKAESLLKLHQLDDADLVILKTFKMDTNIPPLTESKLFNMNCETYLLLVRAEIDMALGRFENAVEATEKAAQICPENSEVSELVKKAKLIAGARSRGNDMFKSDRLTEASVAYTEGLRLNPNNAVLFCNRAACSHKLGLWEQCVEDCSRAIHIRPKYIKALLTRASSHVKLEQWDQAVKDYEMLRKELPEDNEIAESLFHAEVSLKKSRGEPVHNMNFGGDVEEVDSIEQFKDAVTSPCVTVVHFRNASDNQCQQIAPFVDDLCSRYPSLNFLKVDIDKKPEVANRENVRIVPTFKIYRNGMRLKEMVCPSQEVLENSVKHYGV